MMVMIGIVGVDVSGDRGDAVVAEFTVRPATTTAACIDARSYQPRVGQRDQPVTVFTIGHLDNTTTMHNT